MDVKRLSNKAIISVYDGMILGKGGEGAVYKIPQDSSLVAKIYPYEEHKARNNYKELEALEKRGHKLKVMLEHAPSDPTWPKHCSIAWPQDLLLSTDGSDMVIGFLMPYLEGMAPISNYYNPQRRKSEHPQFRYDHLCRTAVNLASAVSVLHYHGYVIGDVNESNAFVSNTAMVTLIDTDSFQVRDPKDGGIHRCLVGKHPYIPRELLGKKLSEVGRFPEHDMFGITTLFFQLLMEGQQPFTRVINQNEGSVPYAKLIYRGDFPYSKNSRCAPPSFAPPFDMLPARLRELFVQCFEDGNNDLKRRPDARTWHKALKEVEKCLKSCEVNGQHVYFDHCLQCPWCERAKLIQKDPFLAVQMPKASAQGSYGARSATAAQPARVPMATAPPPRPARAARSTLLCGFQAHYGRAKHHAAVVNS